MRNSVVDPHHVDHHVDVDPGADTDSDTDSDPDSDCYGILIQIPASKKCSNP
jgi:hypothetical protein